MGIKSTLDKAVIDITAGERKIIIGLLKIYLPNTTVWAYGSRVKWDARPYSDLDLVAFASAEQKSKVYALKEAFEESNLPYSVDVFIWDKVPENFRKNIKAKYAVVQDDGEKKDDVAAGWKKVRLSDIINITCGGTPKRDVSDFWSGNIPWLLVSDFNNDYRYVSSAEESITDLGLKKSSANIMPKGSLILSARGTVGALSQISQPMAFGQSCYGINANPKYAINNFLYYSIKNSIPKLKQISYGAVFDTITIKSFEHISVSIPPLSKQRAIAHILGTLDDKIELNRRMNETLEGMARALFKSWFVDFDPVHAKAALYNHSPLAGESASQGQSPLASRWGDIKRQYKQSNLNLAKTLRHNSTDAENILWHYLRKKQLAGRKFRRQQPIGNHIVDFVCTSDNLVVELDGGHARQINHDADREKFLQDKGYRELRYWNNQVISDCYVVLEDIYNHLCSPPHQPSATTLVSAISLQGDDTPPTGLSAGFALDSPTPPQGGSNWTVERAKQYLAHMDAETAALFPDRLVDSELGKIPEGWEVKGLDEIADFKNGLALQKLRPQEDESRLPVIKIAQLRSGQADSGEWASADIMPECIIENGDVIFSWSGSLMVTVWCGEKGALNQHLFKVTSKKYPKWFYLHCTRYHLPDFQRIAAGKAVTMGHIKRHHLAEAKCVEPNKKILSVADKIFSHILDQSISLDIESRSLARQRDTLLPKLISGKIPVNNVEKIMNRIV